MFGTFCVFSPFWYAAPRKLWQPWCTYIDKSPLNSSCALIRSTLSLLMMMYVKRKSGECETWIWKKILAFVSVSRTGSKTISENRKPQCILQQMFSFLFNAVIVLRNVIETNI
jgi:hypothetical protein